FFTAALPVWGQTTPSPTSVLSTSTPSETDTPTATVVLTPSPSPTASPIPNQNIEGYWYQIINNNGVVGRFSLFIERNSEEITEAFLDDIDNGKYHQLLGHARIEKGK